MFAALLPLIPSFLLRFVGGNVLSTVLAHKREQSNSAGEIEKARLEHEIKKLDYEVRRRDQQKELALKDAEHPFLWWPRMLLLSSVSAYWSLRFAVKAFGLDDYGVAISELSTEEAAVSGLVLSAILLPSTVKKVRDGWS